MAFETLCAPRTGLGEFAGKSHFSSFSLFCTKDNEWDKDKDAHAGSQGKLLWIRNLNFDRKQKEMRRRNEILSKGNVAWLIAVILFSFILNNVRRSDVCMGWVEYWNFSVERCYVLLLLCGNCILMYSSDWIFIACKLFIKRRVFSEIIVYRLMKLSNRYLVALLIIFICKLNIVILKNSYTLICIFISSCLITNILCNNFFLKTCTNFIELDHKYLNWYTRL